MTMDFIELILLLGLFGIISGLVIGRLAGRWLLAAMPLAVAATILPFLASAHASTEAAQAGPAFPDRNRQAVVDAAGVIPNTQERALANRIGAYVARAGHQLVVATMPSLDGLEIRDYGYRLGRTWGLGQKGVDDGVILLLAPTERKVNIEVGYGLEPTLTDALTSTIIQDRIKAKLKADDIAGALTDGADPIMAAASGKADDTIRPAPQSAQKPEASSALDILTMLLLLTAPTALLIWWLRRCDLRRQTGAERIYADIKKANPARPYPGDKRGLLRQARARRADDIASGIAAAALAESITRRSDDSSSSYNAPSYSAPSSASIDTGSFDSGGGSFGGGGASSDY